MGYGQFKQRNQPCLRTCATCLKRVCRIFRLPPAQVPWPEKRRRSRRVPHSPLLPPPSTIGRALSELRGGEKVDAARVRRAGGGRKSVSETDASLLEDLRLS